MRTIALVVLLAFVASLNASLSESNIFRGSRPIIKFCDSHCNEACGRLQVQSDFRMKCENACRWSCDHKRNAHLQPAVMSDAKFFKKAFKKIKGVVKKVTSVVKKVIAAPTTLLTKVVAKLPLPSGLKKVLSVVAPIALGFITGGAGALSGLKSIGFVSKAINAVKATKVFQVGMKVVNTVKKVKDVVDKVKGVVNTVKGIAKGDFSAIGGLAGQIGGIGSSVGGKFGQFTQNIGNKINSIGGKITSTIKNSAPYKAFQNIKGKVMDIKNKITGRINGIVGKVVDFKNNALGKLDRFGVIGGFVKDKINDKINGVVDGIKGKIQDKISSIKEKILQKTGIAKIRDRLAGVQPEQQEGPAPEAPAEGNFQESSNPGEEPAPVDAAPQEAANPGEEVSSDVETFKRKRGGRKQKKVQPVEQVAAIEAEAQSDAKFFKKFLKSAGGFLKGLGKQVLNSAKEGAMGYIQTAIA